MTIMLFRFVVVIVVSFCMFCGCLFPSTDTARGQRGWQVMVYAFDIGQPLLIEKNNHRRTRSCLFLVPQRRRESDNFESSPSSPSFSTTPPQQQQRQQRREQLERLLNRAVLLYNEAKEDANVRNQVAAVIVTLGQERERGNNASISPASSTRKKQQQQQQQQQTNLDAVEQFLDSFLSSSTSSNVNRPYWTGQDDETEEAEEAERNRAAQRIEEAILTGVDYATIASMVQDYSRRFGNSQLPDMMDNPATVYGADPTTTFSMDMDNSNRYYGDDEDDDYTDEDGYQNEQEVRQVLYKAAESIEQAIERGVPFDQINEMVEAYARVKQRLERTSNNQQQSATAGLASRKQESPPLPSTTTSALPATTTTRTATSIPPRKVVKRVRASAVGSTPSSPAPPSSKAAALPRTTAPQLPAPPQTPTSSIDSSSSSTSRSTMPVRTRGAAPAPKSTTRPFVPPPQLQRQTLLARQMEDALLRDDDDDDDSSGSDPVERFLQSLQQSSSQTQSSPSSSPTTTTTTSPIQPPQTPQAQQQKTLAPNQKRLAQQLEDALLQDFDDNDDSGSGDPIQRFMTSLQAQKSQQQQPVTIPSNSSRSSANGGTPNIMPTMTSATTDLLKGNNNNNDSNVGSAYTSDRIESFIQSLREIRQIPKESSDSTTTSNTLTGGFATEERPPPVVKEALGMTGNQKSSLADAASLEERRRMVRQLDAYLENASSRFSSVPFYFANNSATTTDVGQQTVTVNDQPNRERSTISKNDVEGASGKKSNTPIFKPTTVPPAWLLEKDEEPRTNEDLERLENKILKYLTPRATTMKEVAETGTEGISLVINLAAKATPIVGKGVEFAWSRLGSAATALYKRKVDTDQAINPLEGLVRPLADKEEATGGINNIVSRVASADTIDPKSSSYLFQLRTAKVAAAAKAGQSRWNEMENQRAIQLMESKTAAAAPVVASGPKTVSGVDLIPNIAQKLSASYLFQQRIIKVAKAAKADQSRWGAMENQRAIQMMEGKAAGETTTLVPAPAEITRPMARGSVDSTLYQQRNRKVAAAAAANQSRWGEMENRKVAEMMGIPLPQSSSSSSKTLQSRNKSAVSKSVYESADPQKLIRLTDYLKRGPAFASSSSPELFEQPTARTVPPTPTAASPLGVSAEQLAREWAAMNRDASENAASVPAPAVREVVSSTTGIGVISTAATTDDVVRPDGDGESNDQTSSKASDRHSINEERKVAKVDRVAFLRKLQAETQITLSKENRPKIDRASLMRKLNAPSLPVVEPATDWEQKYAEENASTSSVETRIDSAVGWELLAREWAQRNSDEEKFTIAANVKDARDDLARSEAIAKVVMSPSSAPASSAGGGWEQLANDWARMNQDHDSPKQGGQSMQSKPAISDTRSVPSDVSLDKEPRKIEVVASSSTKGSSAAGGRGWEQLANDWVQRNRDVENTGQRPYLLVTAKRTEKPTTSSSVTDLPQATSAVSTGGWEQLAMEWANLNASSEEQTGKPSPSPSQTVTPNFAGQGVGTSQTQDSSRVGGGAAMETNGSWEDLGREWAQRNRSD